MTFTDHWPIYVEMSQPPAAAKHIASSSYQVALSEPLKVSKPEQWPKWIRRIEHFRSASSLAMKDGRVQVDTLLYAMGSDGDDVMLSFHLAEGDARLLMATTHLFATPATAVSTTTPALRCYSSPPVSSRAAPPHFSRYCIGENEKVRCVCGSGNETVSECLQCGLWSHVQRARLIQRKAKRSQFSCQVCRAVLSKRKKGYP